MPGASGRGFVLFDWGDTLMRDFREFQGPMAFWPRVELMPHAREVLVDLKADGWSIALATNARDSSEDLIRQALQRGAISHLVDRIYCFANVGAAKPDIRFFEHVLHDLGESAGTVVMVGDDYDSDVRGALDAGLRAVWVSESAEPSNVAEECHQLSDLGGLANMLRAMDVQPPSNRRVERSP
jgi:HAD superfamily hydrolase (TIGR01509 family)